MVPTTTHFCCEPQDRCHHNDRNMYREVQVIMMEAIEAYYVIMMEAIKWQDLFYNGSSL